VLIKSIFRVFWLTSLTLPHTASVAKKLETIQRKFLKGPFGCDFIYNLVRWNIINIPMTDGGLGVKHCRLFNEPLLSKWLWRYMNEKGNLRRRLVSSNTVIIGSDGIPLNLMVLMAEVWGDTFTKDGADFIINFLLRSVLVVPSFLAQLLAPVV